MKLLDYMKANHLSDAALAALLGAGVSEGAVKKWKYGERSPRVPDLVRLEDATCGAVTARDFLPSSQPAEAAQ